MLFYPIKLQLVCLGAGLFGLNRYTGVPQKSEMEGRVSNVEICNLAYTGKFEELKKCVLSDSSLATKTDQVSSSGKCLWRAQRLA